MCISSRVKADWVEEGGGDKTGEVLLYVFKKTFKVKEIYYK